MIDVLVVKVAYLQNYSHCYWMLKKSTGCMELSQVCLLIGNMIF